MIFSPLTLSLTKGGSKRCCCSSQPTLRQAQGERVEFASPFFSASSAPSARAHFLRFRAEIAENKEENIRQECR